MVAISELGKKMSARQASQFFEVAESTVLRHPSRYGGVKLGRRVMFFENLIGEAIRRHYALQAQEERENRLDGASQNRRQETTTTVHHEGRRKEMGSRTKSSGSIAARADDPHDLLS